jgi:hypothetical protein
LLLLNSTNLRVSKIWYGYRLLTLPTGKPRLELMDRRSRTSESDNSTKTTGEDVDFHTGRGVSMLHVLVNDLCRNATKFVNKHDSNASVSGSDVTAV